MIDGVPGWIISLLAHLMAWTIEANNGPPGDDRGERENRPFHWNASYFDAVGILCVVLPLEHACGLFIERIMTLHEEPFLDATGAFLRGFDRATIATDMPQPENPAGVRSLFVERLLRGHRARSLSDRESFTAEHHLGDALHALFYQPASFVRTRPHVPDSWNGLLENTPILMPLLVSFPQSGYLAVVFLTLMETYPCPTLLPAMVQACSAWRRVHAVGAHFWNNEHRVGHRICEWINRAMDDEFAGAENFAELRDDLSQCLDVLVRSGIASARDLEARLSGRGAAA